MYLHFCWTRRTLTCNPSVDGHEKVAINSWATAQIKVALHNKKLRQACSYCSAHPRFTNRRDERRPRGWNNNDNNKISKRFSRFWGYVFTLPLSLSLYVAPSGVRRVSGLSIVPGLIIPSDKQKWNKKKMPALISLLPHEWSSSRALCCASAHTPIPSPL